MTEGRLHVKAPMHDRELSVEGSTRHAKRSWTKRLLVLSVGAVIASLMFELLILTIYGEQPKFPRHVVAAAWDLRYNDPGSHYRHKSADVEVHFRINNQGMRADRDFAYEKLQGVRRVVSLGDSMTIGYEVEAEDTFSSVLEKELNAGGLRVEVLNAGVSGFSTAEECLYLERELMKYGPDVVLVNFSTNDLVDNVRTGLFELRGGQLVQMEEGYVPAGGLGNALNTNWFFNLLSERSNAFSFVKEQLTYAVKKRMVRDNERNLDLTDQKTGKPEETTEASAGRAYQRQLMAAILERTYQMLRRQKGILLVVQSIPAQKGGPRSPLVETFPLADFRVDRPGLAFLSSKELLDPYVEKELLFWQRSHFHLTPFSHKMIGQALARLIQERNSWNQ